MLTPGDKGGFTKGAIVRMHLKDFMTYSEVEFTPGPNLNLILGPNGTGKSTIVSAICLGMSGKPSTIARASQLGGYVRHGASKALIDMELHNPDGDNFCITREITVENKSSWKLQGKPATHTQVEEVIRKLHIQVDNLCQFLPQEQVQNFSRLKDKQLLTGTMKAVGKPELEEQFEELNRMQSNLGSVASHQEKDEQELKKLQDENKRWEGEVQSFKEREALKHSVKTLGKKKAWLTYKEEVRQFKEMQEKASELKERYTRASASFKPLEKKIAEKENSLLKSEGALKTKRERIHQEMASVNEKLFAADQQKQKMETLAGELNATRTSEKKRQESMRHIQQQINSFQKELEELKEKEDEITNRLREIDREMKEIAPKETALEQKKQFANDDYQQLHHQLNEQKSKAKTMEDVDRNRIEMVRRENDQVFQAITWLRANKDRFSAPIHEPPILSINVRNSDMAKYVEGSIGWNDLWAFFCEDKNDMNRSRLA